MTNLNELRNNELKNNYEHVLSMIQDACKSGQRSPEEVTLIAVSKTYSADDIWILYDLGCRHFGENKVQELTQKQDILPKDICWHMIGHLQTNKVKYLVGRVDMIHGVDSLKLAQEIQSKAQKEGIVQKILLEVNIAREDTKYGLVEEDVLDLIRMIHSFENISIQGLMTIAPYVTNATENQKHFRKLKQLSVDIMRENIDNVSMNVLSMGMSGDYVVAIQEGATMVRVGTGLFGKRNYNI